MIIGNPPYNANQQNENDNNKNRAYPHIDGASSDSYIKLSTAQKTKRLRHVCAVLPLGVRPAARRRGDRLRHQPQLHRQPDLRRVPPSRGGRVQRDLSRRSRRRRAGESEAFRHEAQCLRHPDRRGDLVLGEAAREQGLPHLLRTRPEIDTAEDKLPAWRNPASGLRFDRIEPDKRANWINQNENDWDDLIPVADKKTKAAKSDRRSGRFF